MKKEGYITIYLSLITAVMLVFIITLTEATRCQTIRFQTECVMDMGMTSIFAEYNRELLAQYGLLGIDTSYGKKNAKEDNTKHHLLEYMNKNFVMPGLGSVSNYKDMTGVHADNAQLTDVSFLSDENGNVLKYQIVNYMKEKTGLSYVDSVMSASSFLESDNKYRQLENDKDSSFGQVNEILNELNAQREEEQEEISIENPADQVERLRNSLLLDMAIADGSTILRKEVVLSNYISHRAYNEGVGLWESQKSQGIVNDYLFRQYLTEKCGYYGNEKDNSALGYQLEYLLYGKSNDFDNLDAFADQVFKARYVINAAYLFGNSAKISEANALAMTVTAGIGSPQLSEAVKITILFSWCYAETVQDIRILFDGYGVARVKDDSTWNTPLEELLMFTSTLDSYHAVSGGKTYFDYLREFLFVKGEKTLRMRLMDIMEMDIQRTAGNHYFQMDNCIYQLRANVNVSSSYGYGYSIERDYSYE